MKNIYTLTILVFLSLSGYSKNYFIYTAKTNGNWSNAGTWNTAVRNDNVLKDKFIIPAAFTVTAGDEVNSMGYTDIELQISGQLTLGPSVSLHFGNASRIEILATGSIDANGASQQIYIGTVSKYTGNKNKNLQGPLFADASTGIAPNGFSNFALLPVNVTAFSATIINDQTIALKWTVSSETENSHYQVERRVDSKEWSLLGVVIGNKKDAQAKPYSFSHTNNVSGTISYRLKHVREDGKWVYSNVVSINARKNPAIDPANILAVNKTISIGLSNEVKTPVEVKIMSMNGYVLNRKTFLPSKNISFTVEHLKRGPYLVYVSDNVNKEIVRRVFIN